MKLRVKHFFADFHFLGIVLDLDTYTFRWQMYIWREGGGWRLS